MAVCRIVCCADVFYYFRRYARLMRRTSLLWYFGRLQDRQFWRSVFKFWQFDSITDNSYLYFFYRFSEQRIFKMLHTAFNKIISGSLQGTGCGFYIYEWDTVFTDTNRYGKSWNSDSSCMRNRRNFRAYKTKPRL